MLRSAGDFLPQQPIWSGCFRARRPCLRLRQEKQPRHRAAEELPVNWDALPEMNITPEPPKPSMRAEDLPSAAEALAEIFPEEKREPEESAPEDISEAPSEDPTETDPCRKRRLAEAEAEANGEQRRCETRRAAAAPAEAPPMALRSYSDWAFEEKLASHREWVESHGNSGKAGQPGQRATGRNGIDRREPAVRRPARCESEAARTCCWRTCGTPAWCGRTSTMRAWWARISKARTWKARRSTAPWAWCRGNWRARICGTLRCPSRSGNSTRRAEFRRARARAARLFRGPRGELRGLVAADLVDQRHCNC